MGILRDPWTGEQIRGRHVPMVTEAEFARVQVVVAGSANSTPHHRASETFPLRGLVRCPSCQRFLTAAWSRGRRQRYAYYSCFYQGCPTRTRSYRAADVHDEFTGFLRTLSVSDRIVNQIVADIEAESCSDARQANELGDKALAAKRELEGQLQELISMRIAKSVLDSEFVVQRDRLRRQITECEAQIASRSRRPLTRAEARTLTEAFQHLDCYWRQLGSNSLLLPSGYEFTRIRTAETALLFRVTGASSNQESHWVRPVKWNLNTMIGEIRAFLAIIQLDSLTQLQRMRRRDPFPHREIWTRLESFEPVTSCLGLQMIALDSVVAPHQRLQIGDRVGSALGHRHDVVNLPAELDGLTVLGPLHPASPGIHAIHVAVVARVCPALQPDGQSGAL
jgi:hypothetical protein